MKHKQNIIGGLILFLAMLVVAGCATPQATPGLTSAAQGCPTAPACPTPIAAQLSSIEKSWKSSLDNATSIIITFDVGDKCSVDIPSGHTLFHGMLYYNIKVNDQARSIHAVVFQTLDEGKTLQDLQAYPKTATSAPSWVTKFLENYVNAGTNSYFAENFSAGQIYISCFVAPETGFSRVLDYGPLEIK